MLKNLGIRISNSRKNARNIRFNSVNWNIFDYSDGNDFNFSYNDCNGK